MMKYHFSILLILLLGACSSRPNTDIIVEKNVHLMHRQEVINAIEDCKTANLRPVMFYSIRYVNDKPIPMIADITCAPRSGH
jgi:hypothetical protein